MARRKSLNDQLAQAARDTITRLKAEDAGQTEAPPLELPPLDTSRCPHCCALSNGEVKCPACGYDTSAEQSIPQALPAGVVLQDRFIVGEALVATAEGLVYRAFDQLEQQAVDLREFLPMALATRDTDGRSVRSVSGQLSAFQSTLVSFLSHADTQAQLKVKGVLPVLASFQANGTGYVASAPAYSPTLLDRIDRARGVLSWPELSETVTVILGALQKINEAELQHLAVSPDCIVFDKDGAPALAGFAAEIPAEVDPSDPYTAPERVAGSPPTAAADIYSMGATILHALTGTPPPPAQERKRHDTMRSLREVFELQIPREFSDCIDKALALTPSQRWASAAEMLKHLSLAQNKPTEASVLSAEQKQREEVEHKAKEDAERKEAEQKQRMEAERKAKEDAERKEAEQKQLEEAERKAKENSARKDAKKKQSNDAESNSQSTESHTNTASSVSFRERIRLFVNSNKSVLVIVLLLLGGVIFYVTDIKRPAPMPDLPPTDTNKPTSQAQAPPPQTVSMESKARGLLDAGKCAEAVLLLKKEATTDSEKALLAEISKPAKVTINAWPWVKVYLDGKERIASTTSGVLSVPCGEHTIRLEKPTRNTERSFTVNLKPGQTHVLNFPDNAKAGE